MKKTLLSLLSLATITLASCGGSNSDSVEAKAAGETKQAEETATTFNINTEESTVVWVGSKLAYNHTGNIQISEGSIAVVDGGIDAGNFVIDMTSITCTDLEDAEDNAKLVGHLKSPDFFNVDSFSVAKFEITSAQEETITGNLTIKGITKEISFPARVSMGEGIMKAAAEFTIDRTDWDVRFGSATVFTDIVKDKAISDEISFSINLVGSAN